MSGYTKLFGSILASTVWELPLATKVVWITMLAMADMNGDVQASIPGLAKMAGVSREECEAALASFLAPDKYSRSKESDGRRIEEVDGGWRLINHAKYTQMLSAADRRERGAERQKRYRWKALAPLVGPIVVRDGNRCGICGVEFKDADEIQFDHIIPTSKGGDDSLDNIQRAHAFCNQSKHNIRSGRHGRHPSMPPLRASAVSPALASDGSDNIRLRSDTDKTETRSEPDSSAVPSEPAEPAVLVFPCNGEPKTWDLTKAQIATWTLLYPGVPVETECRKALAWVLANGKKTAGGMLKFLVRWLNKQNDQPRAKGQGPPYSQPIRAPRPSGPPVAIAELAAERARKLEEAAERERKAEADRFRQQQEADKRNVGGTTNG